MTGDGIIEVDVGMKVVFPKGPALTEEQVRLVCVGILRNALNDIEGLTAAVIQELEAQGATIERKQNGNGNK